MNKKYVLSLFIFRRDLRLDDNTGLLEALKHSEKVFPCFIFDPQQISNDNAYRSGNALQFMVDSLDDLSSQLEKYNGRLYRLHGVPTKIIEKIIKQYSIEAIFINHDYTPFSIRRDQAINELCVKSEIDFHGYHDYLLTNPDKAIKNDGTAYKVFTPFYKAMLLTHDIAKPIPNTFKNYFTGQVNEAITKNPMTWALAPCYNFQGGRQAALKILSTISSFYDYKDTHDFPSIKTTQLSAHHKFGTCSIRESYYALVQKKSLNDSLVKQLYWRDFFTIIAYYHPHIFGKPFKEKYNKIKWSQNIKLFKHWCLGETGYPIVDAGMRELNQTGFMHNRVRMVVASFLVKTLGIDWRWGEKYFAQHLIDYDPSVNNGNWQWVASTGCDAQPYFRIFNPWLQQKKFDPDCTYIKKWIPELKGIEPKLLHKQDRYIFDKTINYPEPIVNYSEQRDKILKMFKNL